MNNFTLLLRLDFILFFFFSFTLWKWECIDYFPSSKYPTNWGKTCLPPNWFVYLEQQTPGLFGLWLASTHCTAPQHDYSPWEEAAGARLMFPAQTSGCHSLRLCDIICRDRFVTGKINSGLKRDWFKDRLWVEKGDRRDGSSQTHFSRERARAGSKQAASRRWILASCIIDKLYVLGVSFKEGARTISGSYFSLSEASIVFILSSPVLWLIFSLQKAWMEIIVFFEGDIQEVWL